MATTQRVSLQARTDDWDELTEFAEDLSSYVSDRAAVYNAVQAIAEGRVTTLDIPTERVKAFTEHMREFRIDVEVFA